MDDIREMTLKEAREHIGMSQSEMNKKLEIPEQDIENWESGTQECPPWAQRLILDALRTIKLESDGYMRIYCKIGDGE
jgi:DNA-binding transcriptional regulator YiaG